jgi:two-component system LytT family sensor kinase
MIVMKHYVHSLIFSDRRSYRLTRHLLFWLLYYTCLASLDNEYFGDLKANLHVNVSWMPLTMLNIFVTLYWLVPKYLMRSKWKSFAILYGTWALMEIPLGFLTHLYLTYPYCWAPGPRPSLRQAIPEILDIYPLVIVNVVTLFAVFIRMFKFWRVEQLQKLQIKKEKTDAELQLLRAQLHPHFLFNTLNNLYTLILEKSSKAPEMLSRLSAILSYVLNDCQAPEVPLRKEIAFCRAYIELEGERYGNRLELSVEFPHDFGDRMIAPMLFQPFIENAFKHGAAEQVGKVWMSIGLSVRGDQLLFRVINSADLAVRQRSAGGIGIANIQRRLELLYPDRHQLLREQDEDKHLISLTIDLPSTKPGRPARAKENSKPGRPVPETEPNYSLSHN